MERELEDAKRMNKAAITLIVIMLILMCLMVANMVYLEKRYRQLEGRYIELYEKIADEKITDLGNRGMLYDGSESITNKNKIQSPG